MTGSDSNHTYPCRQSRRAENLLMFQYRLIPLYKYFSIYKQPTFKPYITTCYQTKATFQDKTIIWKHCISYKIKKVKQVLYVRTYLISKQICRMVDMPVINYFRNRKGRWEELCNFYTCLRWKLKGDLTKGDLNYYFHISLVVYQNAIHTIMTSQK